MLLRSMKVSALIMLLAYIRLTGAYTKMTGAYTKMTGASNAETKLRKNLTASYDQGSRPVRHQSETVNVMVELILRQLIKIDEKEEFIELAVWSRIKWNDPKLRWNETEFGKIEKLNFRSDDIWVPDITLYNYAQDAVDFGGNMDTMNTRIVVSSNGEALWMAPIILKATCKIKVDDFPFDVQHCFFKFGSWTFDMDRLNVSGQPMVTDFYTANQEWHLDSHETIRTEVEYPGDCPGEDCVPVYPDVTFHVHFRRKPLFYQANLIFPIFLLTLLTIATFLLPSDSGERITVAITVMLAVIVFLHMVADMVPESGEGTPRLKVFFFFNLALIFLMTIGLGLVSTLYDRGLRRKRMGRLMKVVVYDKLSWYLRTRHEICPCEDAHTNDDSANGGHTAGHVHCTGGTHLSSIARKIKKEVSHLEDVSKMHQSEYEKRFHKSCMDEWRVVAATFNRILFIFFLLAFILGSIVIFCREFSG